MASRLVTVVIVFNKSLTRFLSISGADNCIGNDFAVLPSSASSEIVIIELNSNAPVASIILTGLTILFLAAPSGMLIMPLTTSGQVELSFMLKL